MGGNTLTLALKEQPNQKLLEQFATSHLHLVIDGVLGERDSVLVGRKSNEVEESFEVWRPIQAFEPEDLEPTLASLVPPPCWLLQITLETDPPREDWELANALARFLAVSCKGAVFYDELGKVIWPERSKQVSAKKEEERIDVVNLSWFTHSSRASIESVKSFLDIMRNRCPEARPTRFGTTEPFQGRLSPDDDQPFLDEWEKARKSDSILLFFTAKSPCWGGSFGFPIRLGLKGRELKPTEDNMRIHLEFDRAVLSRDKDARERIVGLFAEVAKTFDSFYAHGYVERHYLRYRGLSSDAKTEQYPLPLGSEWYGIPPIPMWLSWFGRPYKSLVLDSMKEFSPISTDAGLLVRLGDNPMDLDQLEEVKFNLPVELTAQDAETDPMTRKYRDQRRGRWHYRARSALLIPTIDNPT